MHICTSVQMCTDVHRDVRLNTHKDTMPRGSVTHTHNCAGAAPRLWRNWSAPNQQRCGTRTASNPDIAHHVVSDGTLHCVEPPNASFGSRPTAGAVHSQKVRATCEPPRHRGSPHRPHGLMSSRAPHIQAYQAGWAAIQASPSSPPQ